MLKFMPDHFGRHGFKRPQKMVSQPIVTNILDIEEKFLTLSKDGIVREEGGKHIVDLKKMGVDKLLGTGKPTRAYTVLVDAASESAIEKIQEAGGEIQNE